jgi:hypothetical protein
MPLKKLKVGEMQVSEIVNLQKWQIYETTN